MTGLTRTYQALFRTLVQRCGGCFAIAALVLQFGLSFGHFHAHEFGDSNAAYSRQQTVERWNGDARMQARAERPSKLAEDDDQCPICFSSFLLASSFIPDAPRPTVPTDFRNADGPSARTNRLVAEARRAAFQPRGPPIA